MEIRYVHLFPCLGDEYERVFFQFNKISQIMKKVFSEPLNLKKYNSTRIKSMLAKFLEVVLFHHIFY